MSTGDMNIADPFALRAYAAALTARGTDVIQSTLKLFS